MRVIIDRTLCTGHGRCYALAGEVFAPDDDGYSVIKVATVPPALWAQARLGVEACPEGAIMLTEDDQEASGS